MQKVLPETIIHKIFETIFSFYVKQRTAGKVSLLFFKRLLLVLRNFHSGRGNGHWAIILRGLDTFLIFGSATREATHIYHVNQ